MMTAQGFQPVLTRAGCPHCQDYDLRAKEVGSSAPSLYSCRLEKPWRDGW
jgi:hypothetical protein